jgi:hypothetical protein
MDSLQTLFRAAVVATIKSSQEESPLWEEVSGLGANSMVTCDPTELLERWHEKRHKTQQLFERQRALAQAIREAGSSPSI